MFFDLFAEQEQRSIHICHAGQVSRLHGIIKSIDQLRRIQKDQMMFAVQMFLHLPDKSGIAVRLKFPRMEIFFVVPIIHREGIQPFALLFQNAARHRGDQARVQTAG